MLARALGRREPHLRARAAGARQRGGGEVGALRRRRRRRLSAHRGGDQRAMAMKEELQKAGGGAEPSVGKVEAAGKKFLQDAPLPPAKRAELKKMLDDYLMMQSVLAG